MTGQERASELEIDHSTDRSTDPSVSIGREFHVPSDVGGRLDQYLVTVVPDLTRAQIQRLIRNEQILVSGRPAKSSERLRGGELVRVTVPPPRPTTLIATEMPLAIVYETDDLLVVNKPAGLVVHPAPGHSDDTLANALHARYPTMTTGNALRPGIVHRLDKGTSGLLVIAKTDRAFQHLVEEMKEHRVRKEYLALVQGQVKNREATIEGPIGRHPSNRMQMAVVEGGRESTTHFTVVESLPRFTLLRLRLETGRTHQIRVHLASIGHPIVGDETYGARVPVLGLDRPFLHSWHLGFENIGGETCFNGWAPLPADLVAALDLARTLP